MLRVSKRRLSAVVVLGAAVLVLAACAGPGTYATGNLGTGGLPPGLWRTVGGDACYWARLQGFSGQQSDVIADDFSHGGPRYAQIGPNDAGFKQTGCLPFWQDPGPYARPLAIPGQPFGPGDYKVGVEVAPGMYTSPGAPTANPKRACFWARLNGFGGTLAEVIQNNVSTSGAQSVTIDPSDIGFTSDNCGTWTKVG